MKFFSRIFALAALAALGGAAYVFHLLSQPYQGFSQPVFVDFPRGTGTSAMAAELARKGVIRAPWLFLAARAMKR